MIWVPPGVRAPRRVPAAPLSRARAQVEFVRCNEAYEVLSDAAKRRAYDMELKAAVRAPGERAIGRRRSAPRCARLGVPLHAAVLLLHDACDCRRTGQPACRTCGRPWAWALLPGATTATTTTTTRRCGTPGASPGERAPRHTQDCSLSPWRWWWCTQSVLYELEFEHWSSVPSNMRSSFASSWQGANGRKRRAAEAARAQRAAAAGKGGAAASPAAGRRGQPSASPSSAGGRREPASLSVVSARGTAATPASGCPSGRSCANDVCMHGV